MIVVYDVAFGKKEEIKKGPNGNTVRPLAFQRGFISLLDPRPES